MPHKWIRSIFLPCIRDPQICLPAKWKKNQRAMLCLDQNERSAQHKPTSYNIPIFRIAPPVVTSWSATHWSRTRNAFCEARSQVYTSGWWPAADFTSTVQRPSSVFRRDHEILSQPGLRSSSREIATKMLALRSGSKAKGN